MQKAEIGHYIRVWDQYHSFEYEGYFLAERNADIKTLPEFGDITIRIVKVIKESNPGQAIIGDIRVLPTPRYVPIFIREMTENERLLYVQPN